MRNPRRFCLACDATAWSHGDQALLLQLVCKKCQRSWTAGGTMRSVLVGAWRRKNKNLASHNDCVESFLGVNAKDKNKVARKPIKSCRLRLARTINQLPKVPRLAWNGVSSTFGTVFHRRLYRFTFPQHTGDLSLDATTVSTYDGSSLQQDESIAEPGTILEEPRHLVDIKQSRDACGFQNAKYSCPEEADHDVEAGYDWWIGAQEEELRTRVLRQK
ncbi:hypothetical protein Bca4012_020180 [Brassica carinata]